MNNKILLAVDVENIILENGIYRIFAFSPKQAKSEAEAYIKDKCIDLIDEILIHECEMYNHLRHMVVKVEDILKIKESKKC